jgi:hypothetical protein
LALQLYGDVALRHAGDLDLLAAPQHVQRAEQLLSLEGYRCGEPDFTLGSRQRIHYMRHLSHFGYYRDDHQITLELHWRWFSNPYLFNLNANVVWERGETLAVAGISAPILPKEDTLLLLCAHGAKHAWFRLFWLRDVAQLLNKNHTIDWERLIARAAKLGVQRSLAQGLVLSNLLLGSQLPAPIRNYSQRDKAVLDLVTMASRLIMEPAGPSYHPFTSAYIFKKFHDLRLQRNSRYKLRCLSMGLTCTQDWSILRLPDVLFPLYFVLRPFLWFWRWFLIRRFPQLNKSKKDLTGHA